MFKFFTGMVLLCAPAFAGAAPTAQLPQVELQAMQARYPNENAVVESVTMDLTIAMVNNKPYVTMAQSTTLFLLGQNPTNWADSREYMGGSMELKSMEAYSLVPDKNKYRKMAVSTFTKMAETGDGTYFDDQYAYRFTYPAVGVGTKLVSKTVVATDDFHRPFSFFFGRAIPLVSAKVTVTCPKGMVVDSKLFGYDTAQIAYTRADMPDVTRHTWEAKSLRAYVGDVTTPNFRYFTPHLQLKINSYPDNGKKVAVLGNLDDLYRHNYGYISGLKADVDPPVKQLADSVTMGAASTAEKVGRIFSWVQKNIKYVAIEDGQNGFVPREAGLVLQRRYGDCKDKTAILVAMMRSQGIDAAYAWVGSRQLPYRYSTFPSPLVDDHMVACWWKSPSEPVVLDGTTLFHGMDDVPAFIQGKECLVERGPLRYELFSIPVTPASSNMVVDSVFVTVQNDTLVGIGKALFTGEEKTNVKRRFSGRDAAKYREIVPLVLPKASNKLLVDEVTISDPNGNERPFGLTYRFLLPNYISSSGSNTYVNLNIDRVFQSLTIKPDRWLPVEVEYAMHRRFVCVLTLPPNCDVASLPSPVSVEQPLFGFGQSYKRASGKIILTTDIHFDALLIEQQQQLADLRQMLSKLNQAYLQSIVLIKK